MTRRELLKTTGVAAMTAQLGTSLQAAAGGERAEESKSRYYLLERYKLKNGGQGARLAEYLKTARIGMAERLQAPAPAFVLEALVAAYMPQVVVVSGFVSLEAIAEAKRKWRADEAAVAALAKWEAGDEAAYETLEESVLEAADYAGPLPTPSPEGAKPRVFELRTYHSPTEWQLKALHERFAGNEIQIFHRCRIYPVLYSSTLIGPDKPNLTYLIPFENLAAREKAWAAFGGDAEWIKVRAESIAKSGQITSVIQMALYKAAEYSPVR